MSWRRSLIAACLWAAACDSADQVPRIVVLVGGPGIHGATLAAADINAAHPGDSIEVDVKKHRYNTSAEAAIDIARDVSADPRTIAVVGHNNSSSSLAAAQVYNQQRVVQIAPTSTSPAYTSVGPYSFRMVPDDRHQARMLADIAKREATNGRIAIGYANDDYGRGLLHELQPLIEQAGLEVVIASPHMEPADTGVLRRFAADVRNLRPDVLLWLGRAPPLAVLLAAEPGVPVVGSDGVELGVLESKHRELFDGVRYTRFIDPHSREARFRNFAERYQALTGMPANSEAVYVYDAITLLASLIRDGGNTRERLHRKLARVGNGSTAYPGIGGEVAFDANGDVMRSYMVALVTDTGIVAAPVR